MPSHHHPTEPVKWLDTKIEILDQSRLPWEETYLQLDTYQEVAGAIRTMKVRGAPIIGICAAYGVALGGLAINAANRDAFLPELTVVAECLTATRPTAVNLFCAVQRMLDAAGKETDVPRIRAALVTEALAIHADEALATEKISTAGADLIQDGSTVLTHCNAGSLATGGYGTALGVIKAAARQGKQIKVIATETRPLLQGARLTAWELMREGIPVTLITDSMAGHFMSREQVSCVVVGADRIAANGDTANKIGTYTIAVLAGENRVPFYVAAPTTTIDHSLPSGDGIPIEYRSAVEITHIGTQSIAPENVAAVNPAFDVTPHRFISAIVTDAGVLRAPYTAAIAAIFPNPSKGGTSG